MKDYLKENIQFIILCTFWVVLGWFTGSLMMVVIPLLVMLLYSKQMHEEILFGFFFILALSDSRLPNLSFAADVKNVYILLVLLIVLKEYNRIETRIFLFRYFIPFILVAFYCMQFSPQIGTSFQKTISYIILLFAVPNYFSMIFSQNGIPFLKRLVWFTVFLLLVGFVLSFISPETVSLVDRFRGVLGNPNALGIFCLLFIIFFEVVADLYPNAFSRNEKILIYFLAFYSLIKCGARSSLTAVILFYFFRRFYKISPGIGFVIFLLTVFSYQIISENIDVIVLSLGLEKYLRLDTLKDGSGRLIAWEFAWKNIQQNYFVGRGFFYTEYLYKVNYNYLSRLGHQGSAHNTYLTFWLDTGLIGLFTYLSGLVLMIYKAAKKSRTALPILYAVLFSNQFESWLTASLNPFTIVFLFTFSLIFLIKTDSEKELHEEDVAESNSLNDQVNIVNS